MHDLPATPCGLPLSRFFRLIAVCCALGVTAASFAQDAPQPAPAAEPVVAPRPETTRLSADQKRDLNLLLDVLRDTKIDPTKRREAAASLLARGWPAAIEQLAELLNANGNGEVSTHVAIAQAVADGARPPKALVEPLLKLIGSKDVPLRTAAAAALGRYDDGGVMKRLIGIARSDQRPVAVRLGAIRALAEYRQPQAMETLVALTQPGQARAVSNAAAAALAHLTGITRFGDDAQAWAQWWTEHQHLSPERWLGRLTRNLGARAQQLEQEKADLLTRLTETYNRLYTATDAAQRPALLAEMLSDPNDSLRLLALQLIERNLLSAQPISDATRQAMREELTDPNPQVRAKVATLLRDLGDQPAAKIAAERLLAEPVADVQTAYLSLLARQPLAQAVDAALLLLARPALRAPAAEYLVVAADAAMLTPAQRSSALELARQAIDKGEEQPAIVQLIARQGQPTDGPLLVKLLDRNPAAIRRAAAEAFLTGVHDIDPLLERLNVPALADKALEAAAKRGKTLGVVRKLLAYQPDDELRAVWTAAVAAVAGRLSIDELVTVNGILSEQPKRGDVRIAVLKIAAEPDKPGPDGAIPPAEPQKLALMQELADLYLQAEKPAEARPLYDRLVAAEKLDATARTAARTGQLQAALAAGPAEQAMALAAQWAKADADARGRIAGLLLDAAEAALAVKQTEQAAALVGRASELGAQAISPEDAARLKRLREQITTLQAAPTAARPEA
jgi:hypothetical protein